MNARIRRVGLVLIALFVVLFANLNYYHVVKAPALATDQNNSRHTIGRYARPRGEVRSSDNVVLARSEDTDDQLKRIRKYDRRDLFAHTVGFLSFQFGAVGLESSQSDRLLGEDRTTALATADNLIDYFLGAPEPGAIRLTLDSRVQEAARDALGGQRGAVVALNPKTGAIYALWSNPSYDPNPLASHDGPTQESAFAALDQGAKPGLPRAFAETYPPGSTFKVVTAAAGLANGINEQTAFDNPAVLELPDSTVGLRNFGGGACRADAGGKVTMGGGFVQSCNTTFAQIGLTIGEAKLGRQADLFGFNRSVDGLGLADAVSVFPDQESFVQNRSALAQSSIGQFDVRVTPLQMAMVAAGVANDGVVMRPYVVAEVFDGKGRPVGQTAPEPYSVAMTPENAQVLKRLMVAVVASGTGTAGQVPGVEVGGKTGTAETGEGSNPHAWFVAFAPAQNPQVAVAVVVENGGDAGSEATGGRVAAPMARQVIETVLTVRPDPGG